jgi:dihydrodipicolinate synthase/N-acetylneuraminate lyase
MLSHKCNRLFLIHGAILSYRVPFLSIGAVGGIMALANFAAEPLHQIQEAYLSGRTVEARQIQLSLARINTAAQQNMACQA